MSCKRNERNLLATCGQQACMKRVQLQELRKRASSLGGTTIQPTPNIDDPLDAFDPVLGSLCINTNNKIWLGVCNLWAASGYEEAGSRGMGSSNTCIAGWNHTTPPIPPTIHSDAWRWYVLRVMAVLGFCRKVPERQSGTAPRAQAGLSAANSFFPLKIRSTRSTDF